MSDNHDDSDTGDGGAYDEETLVERTDVGVSITTKLKRGTGTRDQDTITVKAKGHTAEEALEKHDTALSKVEDDVAQRVRDIDPSRGGGDTEGGDD